MHLQIESHERSTHGSTNAIAVNPKDSPIYRIL